MNDPMHSGNELMPLTEFLQETGMSQSTERRLRQEQEDWPPHLSLGKRIYYLRSGWADWLASQARAIRARRGSAKSRPVEADSADPSGSGTGITESKANYQ